MSGNELKYIQEAHQRRHLSGDGHFTQLCHEWIERKTGTFKSLLTHSCTAALEMAALLARVEPGDEVIMPSYTFVSTANAFVLRGAVPVFVDVRVDTFNLNEALVEDAVTSKTKAIVPVHYAGVACEMDAILEIARRKGLLVIEDAAQGVGSLYKKRHLGTIGDLGAYSFHETKNVISGEGGALLLNSAEFVERAEILREKGTNRKKFFRGQVDKYTWVDVGSSYLPSDIIAAFLLAQLETIDAIVRERTRIWHEYHEGLAGLEAEGRLRRPIVPADCDHNAHMYYVVLSSAAERSALIAFLNDRGVKTVFHYVPLHSSPAGRQFGRAHGSLPVTDVAGERLLRLPMWVELQETAQVVDAIRNFYRKG